MDHIYRFSARSCAFSQCVYLYRMNSWAFDGESEGNKQFLTMLSRCKIDQLIKYSQSHLWVQKSGSLVDIKIEKPRLDPSTWVDDGSRYNLQCPEDKNRVCKYLGMLITIPMQECANSLQKPPHRLEAQEYLNALFEFLIFELLMNTIRYDRGKKLQELPPGLDVVLEGLVKACTELHGPVKSETMTILALRTTNMRCILSLYLEEATYEGQAAKETRGKLGKKLWDLHANKHDLLHFLNFEEELQVPVEVNIPAAGSEGFRHHHY